MPTISMKQDNNDQKTSDRADKKRGETEPVCEPNEIEEDNSSFTWKVSKGIIRDVYNNLVCW